MTRNLNTTLKRKRRKNDPMAEFDRLPRDLRLWLAEAQLPWSPRSVLKLWKRAMDLHGGEVDAALSHLTRCETQTLKKEAPRIWGASYPEIQV